MLSYIVITILVNFPFIILLLLDNYIYGFFLFCFLVAFSFFPSGMSVSVPHWPVANFLQLGSVQSNVAICPWRQRGVLFHFGSLPDSDSILPPPTHPSFDQSIHKAVRNHHGTHALPKQTQACKRCNCPWRGCGHGHSAHLWGDLEEISLSKHR